MIGFNEPCISCPRPPGSFQTKVFGWPGDEATAPMAVEAGATILVAGSSIFGRKQKGGQRHASVA
jgi:hypothetical protein